MDRRRFIRGALLLSAIPAGALPISALAENNSEKCAPFRRVRPGDPGWPSSEKWNRLKEAVNGNLLKLESPLAACNDAPDGNTCKAVFKDLKNPYYIGDHPELTQSSGWLDAWRSEPSVYAVAAKTTGEVAAAVNFARRNHLRLVVRGGGHSYQGTSNSADSLLIWTRGMHDITLQDHFVAEGCTGKQAPQPAVTIGAGAMWGQAYDAVSTRGGRYVQGGGCTTVGVAGLIQGGGFGSFSKHYGLAAAALLEAEIVTANGAVETANACRNPDLFWALKGGGGGSFGVVTRMTLRTRELPENFCAVILSIKANSDEAFRRLIIRMISFYRDQLFNPHWGEQIRFKPDNAVEITMVGHGFSREQAAAVWQPFEQWVKEMPQDYLFVMPLTIISVPAQHFWDPVFLKQYAAPFIAFDDRPGAREGNFYWLSNREEAGQFLYAYQSLWLPASLLEKNNGEELAEALFSASRHWSVSLHFNKGLAGAPAEEIAAAKGTPMNPDMLDAFALAIIAGEGEPAFKGMAGHEPDLMEGRRQAARIGKAMEMLKKAAPAAGSYVLETNYFEPDWQQSFWGSNYPRLAALKKKYDPEGLFFVHHGVGSEEWSADGFTRIG